MTPAVSVLLPVRNAAATLPFCLRSIARQSLTDFEVVIVDDGSTDDTGAIAAASAVNDPRFRLLRSPPVGLVAALSLGLTEVRAPVVARMDGDDVMHRHRLRLQHRHLNDDQLDAVGTHVRLFPRASLGQGTLRYERWLNAQHDQSDLLRDAFVECPIAHPTLMVKTDTLRTFGYRDMGWPEDYDLVLRLLEAKRSVSIVPQRLLFWRDHPSRLSRTHAHYTIERFAACRAHFLSRSFLRGPRYILWGFGHTGKQLRKQLAKCDRQVAAIVELHPGRLGQTIFGAPVVAPDALPEQPRLPIVVSVAGATPRAQIRNALDEMGFVELQDYVCCA